MCLRGGHTHSLWTSMRDPGREMLEDLYRVGELFGEGKTDQPDRLRSQGSPPCESPATVPQGCSVPWLLCLCLCLRPSANSWFQSEPSWATGQKEAPGLLLG